MVKGRDRNSVRRDAGSSREPCRCSTDESACTNEPSGEDRC